MFGCLEVCWDAENDENSAMIVGFWFQDSRFVTVDDVGIRHTEIEMFVVDVAVMIWHREFSTASCSYCDCTKTP